MRTTSLQLCTLTLLLTSAGVTRADQSAATRYPIFLAEGFGGLDYYQIEEALEAAGATVCDQPDACAQGSGVACVDPPRLKQTAAGRVPGLAWLAFAVLY